MAGWIKKIGRLPLKAKNFLKSGNLIARMAFHLIFTSMRLVR